MSVQSSALHILHLDNLKIPHSYQLLWDPCQAMTIIIISTCHCSRIIHIQQILKSLIWATGFWVVKRKCTCKTACLRCGNFCLKTVLWSFKYKFAEKKSLKSWDALQIKVNQNVTILKNCLINAYSLTWSCVLQIGTGLPVKGWALFHIHSCYEVSPSRLIIWRIWLDLSIWVLFCYKL